MTDIMLNGRKTNKLRDNFPILFILIGSALLNLWNIWTVDFANKYYAAGVYSMGENLHAFFFNSFDSVGFITIDKPPLGFWIQVLFTKIFGFNGAVLILPEAIASVISVYLIYKIIKNRFSKGAGLVAAAILALTPIFVAVSRNNTIDAILILLLILASNQALLATEKASMKHLIFAGIFIGLGFNVKMLQAYMIVPAIYLTYLIFAKQKFIKKILICGISVIIMIVISLSWVIAVDMIPEENRPYIGSSDDNSALDLAIGYNGISRIINLRTLLNDSKGVNNYPLAPNINSQNLPPNGKQPPANNPNLPNSGLPPNQQNIVNYTASRGVGLESGESGLLRLFNEQNAGQISWFILPSLITLFLMLILIFKRKFKVNSQNIALLFFVLCFSPIFIYFSFSSGISHRYYFATLAPFIAGVVSIGYYYLQRGKKHWFLFVFGASAMAQLYIQYLYKDWFGWLLPLSAGIFAVAFVIMIIVTFRKQEKRRLLTVLLCTLLLLPAFWSATPAMYSDNSQLPIAGPELAKGNDKFDNQIDLSGLIEYLEENREGATYFAMTPSSMDLGAELILQSGEAVMALGGFNGGDAPLTFDEFKEMVENNQVRYAILSNDNKNTNIEIYRWIKNNSILVRAIDYGGRRSNIIVYEIGEKIG